MRLYSFRLSKNKDMDMITHLDSQTNKRAYIVGLIRDDMEKDK